MDSYILQTNHLCKDFKNQHAVSDISLSITRNSVYGLLGTERCWKINDTENDNLDAAPNLRRNYFRRSSMEQKRFIGHRRFNRIAAAV
jgi:hypothetical protein